MSPKLKVEEIMKIKVSNSEFLLAQRYVENEVGFMVNDRSPDVIIRLIVKHIKEQQKGAVKSSNSNN